MSRFNWLLALCLALPTGADPPRVPPGAKLVMVEGDREVAPRFQPGNSFRLYQEGLPTAEFRLEGDQLLVEGVPLDKLVEFYQPRRLAVHAPPQAHFYVRSVEVEGRPSWERRAVLGEGELRELPRQPDGTVLVYPYWKRIISVRTDGAFGKAELNAPFQPPLELTPPALYGPFSYPLFDLGLAVTVVGLVGFLAWRSRRLQNSARAARVEADLVQKAVSTIKEVRRLQGQRGTYLLTDKLGAGGMGVVYRATCVETGEECAVKQLHQETWEDPELRERFRREISICNSLHHPGLVSVIDWGDGFLACELVDGQDLRHRLGQVSTRQAVAWTTEILQALRVAHEHGIVHRDLKPENIMVTARGRIKLMDFGIAGRLDRHSLTRTATAIGTPQYMSPEHLDAKTVTPASDLYSVGVLLYEMLTGHPPFQEDDLMALLVKILTGEAPSIRELRPDLPVALIEVVDRLLQRDPSQRYQSTTEVLDDLNQVPFRVNE